jgi:membrane-bound lytic murein transglycosylase D
MKAGTPVQIVRSAKLDFSHVTPEVFEQRRLEYHLALQEAFFEAYVVSGTEAHVLKKGETLWFLAQHKFEVPVWLLRQYNPDLDFGALRRRRWWCRWSSQGS